MMSVSFVQYGRLDERTATAAATALSVDGYACVPAGEMLNAADVDLMDFARFWDDLPADRYLPGGQRHRFRRYGLVRADAGAGAVAIRALQARPFRQDEVTMPLYGGRPREFAPIPAAMFRHPVLNELLRRDIEILRLASGVTSFDMGIHVIRVVASDDTERTVTPEGRHRDGHMFVGMHLMGRRDCAGGESVIYPNEDPANSTTLLLTEPGDSLIVDDRRVQHEVTPISSLGRRATRDMMIIDFELPADETGRHE